MGHSKQSKQQHHQDIVTIAAKRFRESGLEGLSISQLMQEAGLTHGGFYKHFASRDDLVLQALDCALNASCAKFTNPALSYAQLVKRYLSPSHRDAAGDGCTLAALANDVARSQQSTKRLYTQHLSITLDNLKELMGTTDDAKAIIAFSALSGALSIARAVDDDALSEKILTSVKDYLLTH